MRYSEVYSPNGHLKAKMMTTKPYLPSRLKFRGSKSQSLFPIRWGGTPLRAITMQLRLNEDILLGELEESVWYSICHDTLIYGFLKVAVPLHYSTGQREKGNIPKKDQKTLLNIWKSYLTLIKHGNGKSPFWLRWFSHFGDFPFMLREDITRGGPWTSGSSEPRQQPPANRWIFSDDGEAFLGTNGTQKLLLWVWIQAMSFDSSKIGGWSFWALKKQK